MLLLSAGRSHSRRSDQTAALDPYRPLRPATTSTHLSLFRTVYQSTAVTFDLWAAASSVAMTARLTAPALLKHATAFCRCSDAPMQSPDMSRTIATSTRV